MRKYLLATAAALALMTVSTPVKAQLFGGGGDLDLDDITDALESLMEILEFIITPEASIGGVMMPGERLDPTEQVLGRQGDSYLRPGGIASALGEYYPAEPEIFSPLQGIEHTDLLNQQRQDRATEGMDLAAGIVERRAAATATLNQLQTFNLTPEGMLAADQVRNAAIIASAQSTEELLRLQAEAAQLEADEALKQEWKHQQAVASKLEHGKMGAWMGTRTWSPGTIPFVGGGGF